MAEGEKSGLQILLLQSKVDFLELGQDHTEKSTLFIPRTAIKNTHTLKAVLSKLPPSVGTLELGYFA